MLQLLCSASFVQLCGSITFQSSGDRSGKKGMAGKKDRMYLPIRRLGTRLGVTESLYL